MGLRLSEIQSILLSVSESTNFIYKIDNVLTDGEIGEINHIGGANEIWEHFFKLNDKAVRYYKTESSRFKKNLILVDSLLPDIIGELLKECYFTDITKITDLVRNISSRNPMNFDLSYNYYEHKVKKFLVETVTGMESETGEPLIVKDSGEILNWDLSRINELEDYLFENTKLIAPRTSRDGFGKVYKENNKVFLKVNLQIMVLK